MAEYNLPKINVDPKVGSKPVVDAVAELNENTTDNRQRLQKSLRAGLLNVKKSVDGMHETIKKQYYLQKEMFEQQSIAMAFAREQAMESRRASGTDGFGLGQFGGEEGGLIKRLSDAGLLDLASLAAPAALGYGMGKGKKQKTTVPDKKTKPKAKPKGKGKLGALASVLAYFGLDSLIGGEAAPVASEIPGKEKPKASPTPDSKKAGKTWWERTKDRLFGTQKSGAANLKGTSTMGTPWWAKFGTFATAMMPTTLSADDEKSSQKEQAALEKQRQEFVKKGGQFEVLNGKDIEQFEKSQELQKLKDSKDEMEETLIDNTMKNLENLKKIEEEKAKRIEATNTILNDNTRKVDPVTGVPIVTTQEILDKKVEEWNKLNELIAKEKGLRKEKEDKVWAERSKLWEQTDGFNEEDAKKRKAFAEYQEEQFKKISAEYDQNTKKAISDRLKYDQFLNKVDSGKISIVSQGEYNKMKGKPDIIGAPNNTGKVINAGSKVIKNDTKSIVVAPNDNSVVNTNTIQNNNTNVIPANANRSKNSPMDDYRLSPQFK